MKILTVHFSPLTVLSPLSAMCNLCNTFRKQFISELYSNRDCSVIAYFRGIIYNIDSKGKEISMKTSLFLVSASTIPPDAKTLMTVPHTTVL